MQALRTSIKTNLAIYHELVETLRILKTSNEEKWKEVKEMEKANDEFKAYLKELAEDVCWGASQIQGLQ